MTQSENFVIENGVLKKYRENGETVVQVPEGVARIDDFVFEGCWSLEEIKIPEGVTEIGKGAYSACRNLKEIKIQRALLR